MKIKRNLAKFAAILSLAVSGLVSAQISQQQQVENVFENKTSGVVPNTTRGEAQATATDPGGPGDPNALPINDYAYILFAAGAGLAIYAARKKKMAI